MGSTGLTSSHKNYSCYELELTAISSAAKKAYNLLAHSPHKVTFYSDHASLAHLESVQLDSVKNPRILWLLEDFMCVDFQVKHVSAKQNGIADYLSRLLSTSSDVMDYPCLLQTYMSPMSVIRVVEEDNDTYDYDLLKLASQASDDL